MDNNDNLRSILRIGGGALVLIGFIFTAIGLYSFFSSMGTMSPPKNVWCVFVGFPCIGFGMNMLRGGFLGIFARYTANEVSPPIVDVAGKISDRVMESINKQSNNDDIAERLEKLNDLKDKQLITIEEYENLKKNILKEI